MESLIQHLHDADLSLVIADKDGQIHDYRGGGIRPLYQVYQDQPQLLPDSQLADRVSGKAAAMIAAAGKVKAVYADLMSKSAITVYQEAGIDYHYQHCVEKILNRDQSDLCPIERLALDTDNIDILVDRIGKFLTP